jgi:acetylglutamate kinase
VVLLKYVGMNPVVVHGGGPDIRNKKDRRRQRRSRQTTGVQKH